VVLVRGSGIIGYVKCRHVRRGELVELKADRKLCRWKGVEPCGQLSRMHHSDKYAYSAYSTHGSYSGNRPAPGQHDRRRLCEQYLQ
jgi:hypothetical protein